MFILLKIIFTNFIYLIFGKVLINFFFKKSYSFHLAEMAIYGTILISFFALIINFFFPLNNLTNSIFLLIPILFIHSYKFITKKDLKFIFFSSIFAFLLLIFSKINTPDAGLYHLPFVQILNENKLIVGLNNLHFRFGHISIIQYLSAINYNFINGVEGILIPLASLAVFILLYFYQEIKEFLKSDKSLNINVLFCLSVLIYISFKINRYSSFGNDAIAHLLFFYLISTFLKSNFDYVDLQKTLIISSFIFLNKVTLILAFLIPFLVFLKCNEKKIKIFFSFPVFLILVWLIKNLLTSGCLIYPLEISCYNNFIWFDKPELIKQSISSEAWAKGWPDRTKLNLSQKYFIENFNWLNAWLSVHFKYISKIIIPYIFILALISLSINFVSKKKKSLFLKNYSFKIFTLIFILLLGNIVFFLKFPLYRYGYSYTISLICIFFSISIFYYNDFFTKKLFKYILIISIIVLSTKQISRIIKNYNKISVLPNIKTFSSKETEGSFIEKRIIGNNYYIFISEKECMYIKAPCTNNFNKNLSHKKFFYYDLLFIKNYFK